MVLDLHSLELDPLEALCEVWRPRSRSPLVWNSLQLPGAESEAAGGLTGGFKVCSIASGQTTERL